MEQTTEKKTDRREARTQRAIQDTFCRLLRNKPIEKISVGELCEKADIHRSTFYRHYADVYALLDNIYDEAYQELFTSFTLGMNLDSWDFETRGQEIILSACSLTQKKHEYYRFLLVRHDSPLIQRLADGIYKLYMTAHPYNYQSGAEPSLHYRFLAYGIIGIWTGWILDGCKTPKEQVAHLVERHISSFNQTIMNEYGPSEKYAASDIIHS